MPIRRASAAPAPLPSEPEDSARAAGLRYVSDEAPGIRRRRAGKGFTYVGPHGPVRDQATLQRIRALAIPPAWTDVWICPIPNGHIQATGRDDRGRKQYRYHARWIAVRDAVKYDRLLQFAHALPKVRDCVEHDLAQPGMSREKVLAAVVRLLDLTSVRVGNEEYARLNKSFGLTTLRNRHANVEGSEVQFTFRGKSGIKHTLRLADPRIARLVRQCQEIPGQELFQYLDETGERRPVNSDDVNAYLKEVSGGDFTAKDFRTWKGTVLAATILRGADPCTSQAATKKTAVEAIKQVAQALGNTPAVCRKSYIHPAVLEAHLAQNLAEVCQRTTTHIPGLRQDEQAVATLLTALAQTAHDEVQQKAA